MVHILLYEYNNTNITIKSELIIIKKMIEYHDE